MPDQVVVVEEALKTAIQMETLGRDFYLKASKNCGNEPGQKLFRTLAREEATHRRDFEKIYEAIRYEHAWPKTRTSVGKIKHQPHLSSITAEICQMVKPEKAEIEAVKTAIKMENTSYDFYRKQSARAVYPAEKEFYTAVSATENGHRLALIDYLEFLEDPEGYFVSKEHPSLD